jgi:hypothetical protein
VRDALAATVSMRDGDITIGLGFQCCESYQAASPRIMLQRMSPFLAQPGSAGRRPAGPLIEVNPTGRQEARCGRTGPIPAFVLPRRMRLAERDLPAFARCA